MHLTRLFCAGALSLLCSTVVHAVDLDDLSIKVETTPDDQAVEGEAQPEVVRNLALVWDYDKGHAFYVDELGTKVAGPFEDAYPFSEGLGLAQDKDGFYRLFDADGKVAMNAPEYCEFRSSYASGLVVVDGDGGMRYIDREGNAVITGVSRAQAFQGGFAIAEKDGKPAVINREGKVILQGRPMLFHFGDEIAAVKMTDGGAWYYVDLEGQRVCGATYPDAGAYSQGWAPVLVDTEKGMWNFVDKYGDVMEKKPKYYGAKAFREGVAPVKSKNEKWALVDLGGKKLCAFKYDDLREMHEGRAAFLDQETGLWGFVDRTGKVVIEARFGGVYDFSNGLALVSEGNADIYINLQGDQVFPKKG